MYKLVLLVARGAGLDVLRTFVTCLQYEVVYVFTHRRLPHAEDENRSERSDYPIFVDICEKNSVPYLAVDGKKSAAEMKDILGGLPFDYMVACSWRRLVPLAVLRLPSAYVNDDDTGVINLHRGKLPDYKGASPVRRALEHGDTVVEITAHIMTEELDAGATLEIYRRPVNRGEHESLEQATLRVIQELEPHYGALGLGALDSYVRNHVSAAAVE